MRDDFKDMLYYNKKVRNLNSKILNHKTQNYYVVFKGTGFFIINTDKITHSSGRGVIPISTELNDILQSSFKKHPREYIFTQQSDMTRKINGSMIKDMIKRMFNKKVSIRDFRRAYIETFYNNPTTDLNNKDELAIKMRHTRKMAEEVYYKKFTK